MNDSGEFIAVFNMYLIKDGKIRLDITQLHFSEACLTAFTMKSRVKSFVPCMR